MPIFHVLENEDIIQEGDKTRLDISKSFQSGSTDITAWNIKPNSNGSYVAVTTLKYLDWIYEFKVDIDATNNKLNFSEGGGELTATITSGEYTLAALAAAIKTAMDAAGGTYTVSVTSDKFTITSTSAFSLLIASGTNLLTSVFSHIGFTGGDVTGLLTYSGATVQTVTKTVSVKLTNTGGDLIKDYTLHVISEVADKLYSNDFRLKEHEPEILKYLQVGRSSFKNVHRRVQGMILAWLDKEGYVDIFAHKFTKAAIVDIDEVKEWATFMALRLIHEGLSNAAEDIFHQKSLRYKGMEVSSRDRAVIRLDIDGDGVVNLFEQVGIRNTFVARR